MNKFNPETLLAHHGWVRALGRTLIHDHSRSEDLEQDVWARALSRGPRPGSNTRAWLGMIVRNTARESWRHEEPARRLQHELMRETEPGREFGARRDAQESPAQREQRMEAHRTLMAALGKLEGPFQSVLYMRFVDQLETPRIAALLGRPTSTVRTQLARGLDRLRSTLRARLGADWEARALLLTFPIRKGAGGLVAGGGWAYFLTRIPVAVLATVVAVALAWGIPVQPKDPATQPSAPSVQFEVPDATSLSDGHSGSGTRTAAADPMASGQASIDAKAATDPGRTPKKGLPPKPERRGGLRVLVTDPLRFQPMAGAEVFVFDRSSNRAEEFNRDLFENLTDMETLLERYGERYGVNSEGIAILPARRSHSYLAARTSGAFAETYLFDAVTPEQEEFVEICPLPRYDLGVRVLDDGGNPVADQRLEFQSLLSPSRGQRRAWVRSDKEGLAVFNNLQGKLADARSSFSYQVAAPLPGQGPEVFGSTPWLLPTRW